MKALAATAVLLACLQALSSAATTYTISAGCSIAADGVPDSATSSSVAAILRSATTATNATSSWPIGFTPFAVKSLTILYPGRVLRAVSNTSTPLTTYITIGNTGRASGVITDLRDLPDAFTITEYTPAVNVTVSSDRSTMTFQSGLTAASLTDAFVIGCDVMNASRALIQQSSAIQTGNAARYNNARVLVVVEWTLIGLSMLGLVMMSSVFLTWIRFLPEFDTYNVTKYTLLTFVIINIASWFGGFFGWVISGVVLVLVILVCATWLPLARFCPRAGAGLERMTKGGSGQRLGRCPAWLTRTQKRVMLAGVAIVVVLMGTFTLVFFVWSPDHYLVYRRDTQQQEVEIQPSIVAKGLLMAYSFNGLAAWLHLNNVFSVQSDECGKLADAPLNDAQKDSRINQEFIVPYKIDMSQYVASDYRQYSTLNEWFERRIRPDLRPIHMPGDPTVLTSGADSRTTVFKSVPEDSAMWLKGNYLTVGQLLNFNAYWDTFAGGSAVIHRLAPQDYHRFHSPMTGTVLSQDFVSGPLYSVSADGMRSKNGAIFNHRMITILKDAAGRLVAYVNLGATCVGSIIPTVPVGGTVRKGGELGTFAFGGSTIVMLFPPATVAFDPDLAYMSSQATETLVQMGMPIARWIV
ncbi:unnamed protein product (mitochondrion) [Plasmodiophora brassicae]|uniref:Phosphatidylserine decarboxylase n=1 Tax=Plasmodiophora brassicae TaxID=37360 RepID=A0A3P3Y9C0_PLABS|nr:unnamed protein product [Plasmodiophora brassicae]